MSISGPDIITYIGIPLAVLGVLPIIYNTISTLTSLVRVRRALRHGRLTGITRGDVVNHVIEVELPRYTIAPLDRQEQSAEYWKLCDYPSQIPGGTWTTFNWRCHTIGLKTQRIDYPDQLRQPQADIAFEELVSFLLDLGAVPDPVGFRMLRASGLWVPTGTTLLRAPSQDEPVLTVAPLDDSDGHLSLAVRWSSNWAMRDPASLPPYWLLIKGSKKSPTRPPTSESTPEKVASEVQEKETDEEPKISKTTKYIPEDTTECLGIRCQIGTRGLINAVPDEAEPDMFDEYSIGHLKVSETLSNTTGIWFSSAMTAFGTTSHTILWNYKIPSDILAFSKKDTIPCGILVLLDIVPEESTPEWATQYRTDEEAERDAQFRKMNEESRAMMSEARLSPEEKARAVRERHMRYHDDWVAGINAKRRRDTERADLRVLEALQSPKWDHTLVAQHLLAWLKKEGMVEDTDDLKRAVEILLWRMVDDPTFAAGIGDMLDSWKAFVDNGGIRRADYLALREKLGIFAYASLLLAIIKDSVTAADGSLAMDLQECVRIWKKVRLG